jgi:ubiquinone/menaquinone biosynthesis C-methylase UbiE
MASKYILSTNQQAQNRLNLQDKLYHQSSVNLLKKSKISLGMNGLEVGCGTGKMACELSHLVGNTGTLLAIDLSPEQIKSAYEETSQLSNVTFQVANVNELDKLNQTFDFIYCRMVLHHLDDANHGFAQMVGCLKPNGILICEEPPLLDGTFCYPKSVCFEQYVQLVRDCFVKNGKDHQVAYRLPMMVEHHNLVLLHQGLFQPLLNTKAEKMIYAMGAIDLQPQFLKHHLLTLDQTEELITKLSHLAALNSSLSWIRMHQIIARRSS